MNRCAIAFAMLGRPDQRNRLGTGDSGNATGMTARYALPLQAVPVPGAVWLMTPALGLLGWMRRKAYGRAACAASWMLGLLMLAGGPADAATMLLVAHNQRSDSGTLNTLVWAGENASNPWAIANNVTASTAVWDWNAGTGVMTMTGRFETTAHLGSNPMATPVLADRVIDMVIDTVNQTTVAANYRCKEGELLGGFGVNGCANTSFGDDFIPNTTMTYNVGGNANCVQRTISGDDDALGNPRGLSTLAASGGCNATAGAFNLYTVTVSGSQLILSNGIAFTDPNANWLTFEAAPAAVPVPAAVWLFGSALGLLGFARRRTGA